MTPVPPAAVQFEVIDGAELPDELRPDLDPDRQGLWDTERALWSPRTVIARDAAGRSIGAALHAGRPLTAYRKIIDIVAIDPSVWSALIASVQREDASDATHPQPVVVHFEEHPRIHPLSRDQRTAIEALGFTRAESPVPSVPSTRPDDPAAVSAWSWWRSGAPTRIAPYFGQTTEVTCGAVASLMALEELGGALFSREDLNRNRATEIAFWRQATNLPACEPIGLALELARVGSATETLPAAPRVLISTSEPILLEGYEPGSGERLLRIDLQEQSRLQAEQLGVPIERRWIEVTEIAELLRAGAQVLLLIDLTRLIADPTPHWVLATDIVENTIIVSDPWVQYPNGETWVDTYALPLPLETVDLVTRWGDPAYRGVVVLGGEEEH